MSGAVSAVWAVWWRELRVTLRAPIVYVVGGLFLAVQGVAFAGLVAALADPRRPAPLGALLEGQLGGTLLTWVLGLVVLTLLGMRTIAEERRGGEWELLLTAGVGEGAAVVGKWLAASTVYALLWVPTLAYLVVVARYRTDGGGWDVATIATGYGGAIALGAALLAWSVAASAGTTSTLAAGAAGFAALIGLLLVGELPAAWPGLTTEHPTVAAALGALSLRAHLTALARGELALTTLLVLGGLAVVGLSLAITLACAGRRRPAEVRARALGTALLAIAATLAVALAARTPRRWDVSAAARNSLDPATVARLAELDRPATLTIVAPTLGGLEPLYGEIARVLARLAEASPLLSVRRVDPAEAPGGLTAVARSAGVEVGALATTGAVVVDLGGRRRVIDLLALATVEVGADARPVVARLAVEQVVTGALAELASVTPLRACATTGHGELPLEPRPDGADWAVVAARLRGEGVELTAREPAAGLAGCDVVLVAGPARPLAAADALEIQRHLEAGGALIVAAASRPAAGPGELGATGLETVLGARGLALPPAIVVDPTLAVDLPGALRVLSGYPPSPINAGFADARATLWFQPRVVAIAGAARPLIEASAASWGEVDLVHGPPRRDPDDLSGPVALAAIDGGGRVVVVGSAESLSSAVLGGGASAADLWLVQAIRVLAGVAPPPAVGVAPPQVRLLMTAAERRAVVAISIAGIPLAWILGGGALLWWRRRRAR